MSEAVVAKRYAEALFQLGEEKNLLDQYAEEFRTVQEVLQTHDELLTYLQHPQMNKQQKKQFIQNIFKALHRDIVHTIQLLVERKRLNIASSMIDHFIQLVNDAKGVAEATVYSVRKLSDEEREALAGKMEIGRASCRERV